nr:uncharacterized mitochondrial protein AtMg00810-like [Tanacetum cinerariifolium]
MGQQNPTLAKIPILDTGKFEQWQFRIQQYLQHEHYALWEVIEFGDSYEVPATAASAATTGTISDETGKKKGRTVTVTADDMQKRKNDVKARTTLLLSLPDEHQLRFSKYKTAQELWAAILKTFGGNEATKKTKKNLLKKQYGNFKAEGLETLEQTFNSLAPRSQDRERRDNYRQGSKVKEQAPKALMAIDGDWSYTTNDEENHALVTDKEASTEFALIANTSAESKVFEDSLCSKDWLAQFESRLAEHRDREIKYYEKIRGLEYKTESSDDYIEILKKELELIKKEKEGLDRKLTGFQTASKNLDSLLESQRLDKNKEGLGYSVVPPPPAQIYSSPKKNMSWTGLPEFKDDTVTDYSRPAPSVESSPAKESPTNSKTDKAKTAKKPPIKYAEQYRKPTKKPNVRGNQRNWNNLKSHQLGKFEAKGDEGYFIGYFMSSKAFRVFNKRTRKVEENLHVEFLENKAIEKGPSPNWLFDIDSFTKSMNYVLVDTGTNSTNLSGTKDAASQEMKKDVSSLRYIALLNWVHDALLESSLSKPQVDCSFDVPESSGNSNPTATSTNPPPDQLETLTVETPIPTVSSPVPTACLNDSPEPSSDTRLISKRVANQEETPSLDNILTLTNRFEDILGVTTNSVDSDGVEADKISDALQDPSWVEAMQELLQFKVQNVWTLVDCPKGPFGFQDPEFPTKVYKVEKAMYGLHQDPRARYGTLSKYLLTNGFQRGTIDQTLFITRKRGDFILVQVYVDDIIFGSLNPQLCREFEALMHEKLQMSAMVKRIFRYLNGHPKLGLWYPKESPFDLVAYSDSDYGGATQDRKSTTRGCQFLGRRFISWKCKKQTIVATSTIEAEYVAAAGCCGQVLWI